MPTPKQWKEFCEWREDEIRIIKNDKEYQKLEKELQRIINCNRTCFWSDQMYPTYMMSSIHISQDTLLQNILPRTVEACLDRLLEKEDEYPTIKFSEERISKKEEICEICGMIS